MNDEIIWIVIVPKSCFQTKDHFSLLFRSFLIPRPLKMHSESKSMVSNFVGEFTGQNACLNYARYRRRSDGPGWQQCVFVCWCCLRYYGYFQLVKIWWFLFVSPMICSDHHFPCEYNLYTNKIKQVYIHIYIYTCDHSWNVYSWMPRIKNDRVHHLYP